MKKPTALIAGLVLALMTLPAVAGASEGWRPEIRVQTDAQWLDQLDSRLATVHGTIAGTLELIGMAGTDAEVDAYVVIIQANAARGIAILDSMEPARACAWDYAAVERAMFLMWGDSADAFKQVRAGSAQAGAEVNGLVTAASYILGSYGDIVRASTVCEVVAPEVIEPAASVVPDAPAAAQTPTPAASPSST